MSHKIYEDNAARQDAYRARERRKACDAFWVAFEAGNHQGHVANFLALLTSAHNRGKHQSSSIGHSKCPLCQNAELLTVTPPRIPVTVRGASNGN